ncbi:MAG: hypothetical protein KME29_38070 [Calothrix sp. FI2-JRJ7]|jgi:hypothetical protein|nr:hypothetical protein [Calothrix sp. FI2-JRJ7]
MVQQIRQNEPQFICVVPVESITGNLDEEIMSFGISVEAAKSEAEKLLASTYRCTLTQIDELMQKAKIEPIAQSCAPKRNIE